jgi:hypothetical protein
MKISKFCTLLLVISLATAAFGQQSNLPDEIRPFIAAKEAQARALTEKLDLKVAPEIWSFFETAKTGDCSAITNQWAKIRSRSGQFTDKSDPTIDTPVKSAVLEVELAAETFGGGNPKFPLAFGHDLMDSIPHGAILFACSDYGVGVPVAMSRAHAKGDPFFTINARGLIDQFYAAYLLEMYGSRINLPSSNERDKVFQDGLADAKKRGQNPDAAAINGLVGKLIFDQNPEREFFIELNPPQEWLYPHLSPFGPVLKINREPLETLSPEVVAKDREYWLKQQRKLIGDWLRPETSAREICDFVEKVYLRKDLSGFAGDPDFLRDGQAQRMYCLLRGQIGDVYAWRCGSRDAQKFAKAGEDHDRIAAEAGFAFKQAFAFCPTSPEALRCLTGTLVDAKRSEDALLAANTVLKLDPDNSNAKQVIQFITQLQQKAAGKTTSGGKPDAGVRLKKLQSLYDQGLINKDEFEKKKQEIMDSL